METQVQRPQEWKDVHQDEQNHGGHDECHLQLVVAHPARRSMWVVGSHIFLAIGCRLSAVGKRTLWQAKYTQSPRTDCRK